MLKNVDIEKVFSKALAYGGDLAEIFAEHSKVNAISHENHRIEKIVSGIDAGYGLRIVSGDHTIYGYTNNAGSLIDLADTLSKSLKNAHSAEKNALLSEKFSYADNAPSESAKNDIKRTIDLVTTAADVTWGFAKEIKQVQVNWRDTTRQTWIVNSCGLCVTDVKKDVIMVVFAIAEKNGIIQTGYEPAGGMVETSYFVPEQMAKSAAARAVTMLGARVAPRGKMPVIISSQAGGTMVHEAVGHGLEADLACQGMSVYKNKLGLKVASELVTIVDDATLPAQRGSFKYDDEGTPSKRTVLIENGILKTYMLDTMSGKKEGTSSTGNGRRESYRNRPIVRMTNTILAPGKTDPSSIISSVEKGLFVKKMGGGQVNTLNGDFVFEAQEAYLIKKGKIGEPVRGATIIGNGPRVLMNIDMVGTDLGFGLGTCGKEGQGVPVGHGMPTIRIPGITVGGTE